MLYVIPEWIQSRIVKRLYTFLSRKKVKSDKESKMAVIACTHLQWSCATCAYYKCFSAMGEGSSEIESGLQVMRRLSRVLAWSRDAAAERLQRL